MRPSVLPLALFYAAYVFTGGFGQGLALIPGVTIIFWPPSGIFVAALLLTDRRQWPWYIAVACGAELTCNALWFHNPAGYALVYFAANALEALTAAWLVARFVPAPFRMETPEEVGAFVLFCAVLAPMVGATLIALTDVYRGRHPFTVAWPLVWLGDGTGLLVSTPLTFLAVRVWRERARLSAARIGEAALVALVLTVVSALAARGRLPTAWMTLPALLWAAMRFHMRGATAALALVTVTTAAFTMRGQGEFAGLPGEQGERIVMLQTFLGVSAVASLLVAALSLQLQRALMGLREVNHDLEARVRDRTAALTTLLAERTRVEEQLKDADRRKDEFLATLAHELRNPLAPIRNGLQVLKLGRGDERLTTQVRDMIERQVDQMTRLMDDLMDLSRISRGRIVLQRQRLPLLEAVQTAVDTSRPLIEARRHRLVVETPGSGVEVHADQARLTQIVANLLNNAARYTEPGGCITLTVRREGSDVVLSVEDTGIGIPAEMLTKVFDMFTQVERGPDRTQGGLGIGLNIVRQLVELHGGSIVATSAGWGQGSRFTVRLPIALTTAGPALSPSPVPAVPARRCRILVVDDNRDGADSFAEMLRIMGHETWVAYDGVEALAVAGAVRPDVVLMDIGMPQLNGYDACRRLRAEPWGQGILIVAQTGWGQLDDRRRSQEAGFDAHLVKPVSRDALEQLLRQRWPSGGSTPGPASGR